MSDKIIVKIVI